MSYNGGAINPNQLNPALVQAMAVAQAQNGSNAGGNAAFQTFHQAFQRLQSQSSQKLDQQRFGAGNPGPSSGLGAGAQQAMPQGMPGINGGVAPGIQQQQQFLQMMQQAGTAQNGHANSAGINLANIMAAQQAQQAPKSQLNANNLAQINNQLGNMGQTGFNIHSQQQGLNLPGMHENEQGRRQMLQNMLSQQLQNMPPGQSQPPYQTPNQQNISLPNHSPMPGANGAQLREFIKSNPDAIARIQQRHPDNQQALLNELTQMVQSQAFNYSAQNAQSFDGSQMPINYMQQAQSRISPQTSSQRLPSDQFGNMQTQLSGMGAIDPKQMEALQAMKAAQQRGGLVTPQTQANNLPLVSPQASISQSQNMMTPNVDQNQLSQSIPGQSAMPQPQRSMSQSQGSAQAYGNSGADIQNMIQGWGDNQLMKSTMAVVGKIHQAPQPSSSSDPTKFYLLQIIAEWKRRNKEPPPNALQTASQALGNPSLVQSLQNAGWSQLAAFAKDKVDATTAIAPPDRDIRAALPGTQTNPIDIMTPLGATPQIGAQQLAGMTPSGFQNSAQNQDKVPQQQYQQQQQQLLQQQQQSQLMSLQPGRNPIQMPQQQQGGQVPQAKRLGPNPSATGQTTRPWASMDFRSEPIPLKEEQFWNSLANMHSETDQFVPPTIDGQKVNMFQLFTLVHRNGGSAKIGSNPTMWQHMGGYLGFGTESQPGQPQRSSMAVANQLRSLHAQYLQPFEDMFYARLYKEKIKATAAQVTTPPVQGAQDKTNTQVGKGLSAQFLEAVSKAPGVFTDKQRKTFDDTRRLSQSSQTPAPMAGTPSQINAPQSSSFNAPPTPKSLQLAQMAQMSNNPAILLQYIKNREDAMRAKFPKDFKTPSEEERPRLLAELRAIVPAAKEAQEKTPRFLLMAMNSAERDPSSVLNLISMYMFIFVALQYAEAGRYPFTLDELAKLREPLYRTFQKLSATFRQTMATTEGQSRLQKLIAALDQAQAALSISMPPPSTLPEDIASKLPKGIRVEDLKPPPAKRQKGPVGKSSPQAANAATPKTPAGTAESPAASGSGKKPANTGSKRKRQPSIQTPTLVEESKPQARISTISNMLGINLESAGVEVQNAAAYLASYHALRASGSAAPAMEDVLAALMSAMEDQNADAANCVSTDKTSTNLAVPTVSSSDPMSASSRAPAASSTLDAAQSEREDDLFAQFIDVTQVDNAPAWTLPTPELFRVASRDDDADDTSPESIRTVGSTAGLNFKTPLNPMEEPSKQDQETIAVVGGLGSPENNAYNGMIFAGWEDSTFNFVSAQ